MRTCRDAFKNLNIVNQHNQVQISPCCLSPTRPTSTIDFQNDQYLTQVRKDWSQGIFPVACMACKQQEQQGQLSRRLASQRWYQEHGLDNDLVELKRIDYWTGDQCNLACVICGPDWSSGWKQELDLPRLQQQAITNHVWTQLDLSQLRFVHFNGGEPLLSKEHVKFLEAIPDPTCVYLNYNTNATILPTAHLMQLWQKFRLVQLDFSIDDMGERFEYQRYPASWDQVTQNLQWYHDHAPHNVMFAVNSAVGVLNHDNLHQLENWLQKNFVSNRFGDPVEHRKQPVYGLFSIENWTARRRQICDFLDQCDKRRKTSWKSTFPNLVDLLTSDK